MKRFTVLLAPVLVFSLAASAQQQVKPEEPAAGIGVESVIVTAPALRSERALNNFIMTHVAPSPLLGKIGRWKTGICPLAVGLSSKLNTYISQRIVRVAMLAGAPLDSGETCRPNILVVATTKPQELLDFLRAKRPALLGFHYKAHAERLATMSRPIQAWYSTATEDFDGFLFADAPVISWDYAAPGAMGVPGAVHVSGNRAIGDGLKTEFTNAIILVDSGKIAGQAIGPLADYIAMLALSQGQSYDDCQQVPTITNLLASGCGEGMKPDALTDIDATYLRGLYKMDAGRDFHGERSSIAYVMKKELGGY
jgi:hypothetical protein